MQHRWRVFDADQYSEPVEYGLVASVIIAILLTILGVVMLVVHWAGWMLSFFVPDLLVGIVIVGNATYEARGLKGPQISAYNMYRKISRKSRREIQLNPQSLRKLDDDEVRAVHDELCEVYKDEKSNADAHQKSESAHAEMMSRIEKRRRALALDTRECLDKTLYEGWTSEPEDNK